MFDIHWTSYVPECRWWHSSRHQDKNSMVHFIHLVSDFSANAKASAASEHVACRMDPSYLVCAWIVRHENMKIGQEKSSHPILHHGMLYLGWRSNIVATTPIESLWAMFPCLCLSFDFLHEMRMCKSERSNLNFDVFVWSNICKATNVIFVDFNPTYMHFYFNLSGVG